MPLGYSQSAVFISIDAESRSSAALGRARASRSAAAAAAWRMVILFSSKRGEEGRGPTPARPRSILVVRGYHRPNNRGRRGWRKCGKGDVGTRWVELGVRQ